MAVPGPDAPIVVAVDHDRRVRPPSGVVVRRRRDLSAVMQPARRPPSVRIEDAALQHAATCTHVSDRIAIVADACQQRLTTPERLADALSRLPRLRHRRELAAVLGDVQSGARSYLELRYARDVERAHGLPPPVRQAAASLDGRRVWRDGFYQAYGVVHELDGRLGHEWAREQAADRRRDALASADGLVTIRHTYADVLDPCQTAGSVAAVLRARGWDGFLRGCGPACTALA
jgi:hypothetical protein